MRGTIYRESAATDTFPESDRRQLHSREHAGEACHCSHLRHFVSTLAYVRLSQIALASLLSGATLIAGCSSTVDGTPKALPGAGPTEPSYPRAKPTLPPPPTRKPSPPPSPTRPQAPPGAVSLPPDHNGYVFIETKSGQTRCQINTESVGCEAPFTNSPMQDGEHANGVSITADGEVHWILGNLGDIPTVTIDYRTYDAQGWTIVATQSGTRFTNSHTDHGMFVSIERVETY
ncbi:hypothetical protein MSP7336_00707 [Mycobacterium shimoidei]|uniref:Lipoprotein LpqJ n=1 Tax=Mycobacterium shimoidei TaxID=29313 RepID=A0A375YUG7_MYCSH|nr:hypothetical protein MSP7336_00707 [Mycobacterium shimoidei]